MIRIYGLRHRLDSIKSTLSDVIDACMIDALSFPEGKRAHRFFPMEADDFVYPNGRSDAYTVIEISLIEGRSVAAKKRLIHSLFERIEATLGIAPIDVEITLYEAPASHWGFRGMTGDEAVLSYPLDV